MQIKLQKPYLTDHNLMTGQNLCQVFLSNFVNNLAEGIHKIKCKHKHDDNKWQT